MHLSHVQVPNCCRFSADASNCNVRAVTIDFLLIASDCSVKRYCASLLIGLHCSVPHCSFSAHCDCSIMSPTSGCVLIASCSLVHVQELPSRHAAALKPGSKPAAAAAAAAADAAVKTLSAALSRRAAAAAGARTAAVVVALAAVAAGVGALTLTETGHELLAAVAGSDAAQRVGECAVRARDPNPQPCFGCLGAVVCAASDRSTNQIWACWLCGAGCCFSQKCT